MPALRVDASCCRTWIHQGAKRRACRRRIMLPYLDSPGYEASRVLRCLHALQHQVFIEVLCSIVGAAAPEPPCVCCAYTCLYSVKRRRIMLPYLDQPGCEASRVLRCLDALQHQIFIEILFAVVGGAKKYRLVSGLAFGPRELVSVRKVCTHCIMNLLSRFCRRQTGGGSWRKALPTSHSAVPSSRLRSPHQRPKPSSTATT